MQPADGPVSAVPHTDELALVVIAPFLDEERYLPRTLASLAAQARRPDELVLVDDGSSDGSYVIAADFAARHDWVTLRRRERQTRDVDRLATASELKAFEWALAHVSRAWDIVVKLDTDLDLGPDHFAMVLRQMRSDPTLGIAGAHLYLEDGEGTLVRETVPDHHVRGATKCYRAACYEQIRPIPPHLGWDEIDEVKARMAGWRTQSFELNGRPSIHLRPTGIQDGQLRAYRRWGECYWGFGTSVPTMLALAIHRLPHRPRGLASLNLLLGFWRAAARRRPRVERGVRRYRRAEQRQRLRRILAARFARS